MSYRAPLLLRAWRTLVDQTDFDEVALLCPDEDELERVVHEAVKHCGFDNFNSQRNTVYGVGSDDEYRVRYEFLRLSAVENLRIEVMSILDGHSTVHRPYLTRSVPTIIHLSYKCPTWEEYVRRLDAMGQPFAQYESSYGRFAYYGDNPPYIKPRVNLRDQVEDG